MGKLRVVEMVLLAVSALVSAAKGVVKFIDYIGKLTSRPAIRAT